jgi:hypothetical protein
MSTDSGATPRLAVRRAGLVYESLDGVLYQFNLKYPEG